MTGKIDVREIVSDHLATLVNDGTGKRSWIDYFVFFAVPAAIAAACYYYGVTFKDATPAIVITALSIFAGLLINVLVLIYTISRSSTATTSAFEVSEAKFLRQTFANISFAILTAIIAIIVLVVALFFDGLALQIVSAVLIFLLANFVLTMLMTVKRIHIALSSRFLRT